MRVPLAALLVFVVTACQTAPRFEGEPYGEPLTLTEVTPIPELLAQPKSYVGKRVLVEGTIVAVCAQKGCWMDLESGAEQIQVKVDDDVIVFPVSARGSTALVEGIVEERELTSEQAFAAAAHRAEEMSEPFDSTAVYPANTVYRIQGTGALIRS